MHAGRICLYAGYAHAYIKLLVHGEGVNVLFSWNLFLFLSYPDRSFMYHIKFASIDYKLPFAETCRSEEGSQGGGKSCKCAKHAAYVNDCPSPAL